MPDTPTITVPREALPDLEKIVSIPDDAFDALLTAIRETPPTLTKREYEAHLSSRIPLAGYDSLHSILTPIFLLYSIKEQSGASAPELALAVANSQAILDSKSIKDQMLEKLKIRIEKLLSIDGTLGVTAKAVDVMTEHERIFCNARILSDLRPVFSESTNAPSAAVIIHNLQIGYHANGRHQEFYVALDTDDIQTLKKAIERAEKKTTALVATLEKCNLRYLKA